MLSSTPNRPTYTLNYAPAIEQVAMDMNIALVWYTNNDVAS